MCLVSKSKWRNILANFTFKRFLCFILHTVTSLSRHRFMRVSRRFLSCNGLFQSCSSGKRLSRKCLSRLWLVFLVFVAGHSSTLLTLQQVRTLDASVAGLVKNDPVTLLTRSNENKTLTLYYLLLAQLKMKPFNFDFSQKTRF